MREFLQETIDLIQNILSQDNLIKNEYSKIDYVAEYEKLINGCSYLITYPEDKYYSNLNTAFCVINESSKKYKRAYFIGSKEFETRVKENSCLSDFMQGKKVDFSTAQEKFSRKVCYSSFEKDDYFLYEYIENQDVSTIRVKVPIYESSKAIKPLCNIYLLFPTKIKSIDEIDKKFIERIEDNIYHIRQSYAYKKDVSELFGCKKFFGINKHEYVNFMLNKFCVKYKLQEDNCLYFYDKGDEDCDNFIALDSLDEKVLAIDQDGNKLTNFKIDPWYLLMKIRQFSAHTKNSYDYIYKTQKREMPRNGKIYLLKDKALVVSEAIRTSLVDINLNKDEEISKEITIFYAPKKLAILHTEEEIKNYLKRCALIKFSFEDNVKSEKLKVLTKYLIENYNAKEDLKKYLLRNVTQVLGKCDININYLANIDLLAKKCINNKYFDEFDDVFSQEEYLEYIVEYFYSHDIVSEKALLKNDKSKEIIINKKGILFIFKKLQDIIEGHNAVDNVKKIKKLADETYIALCVLLIYANLINNGFDDDISGKMSCVSKQESISLANSLDKDIFNSFSRINLNKKQNDRQQLVRNTEDMKNIISVVRDNISHEIAPFAVKISKNGKPENNLLIFRYDPRTFTKNPYKKNIYYQITCKDFIKFIMDKTFSEYKRNEDISINSLDDLVSKASALLKTTMKKHLPSPKGQED